MEAITKTGTGTKTSGSNRRVKAPKRRFYKRQDKRFKARPKLINSFRVSNRAALLIWRHRKVIGGVVLVYGL
ncbi:MAG TPA: hypothetical protein VFH39_05020, partial [Candidatus Saccharimonadales bacterium]|nr:hypothetical protein [Candidatus Saccharimonadales bacterium]